MLRTNRRRTAYCGSHFDYSGNDPDMAILEKGLANMLITDLVEIDGLQVVERARFKNSEN